MMNVIQRKEFVGNRPWTDPNLGFVRQLQRWEAAVRRRRAAAAGDAADIADAATPDAGA
jgi:hypothetical protein